jgi:hypothetical protein
MIVIPLLTLTSPNTDAEPPEGGHLSLLQRKNLSLRRNIDQR